MAIPNRFNKWNKQYTLMMERLLDPIYKVCTRRIGGGVAGYVRIGRFFGFQNAEFL